ncbi:MAG: helix-hairpin-helix domain-containing protein [Bacteroidaceae bacterium]|nr:helix-hairpin-helix domain-containing protein [Bacteroidaceae bacterium]
MSLSDLFRFNKNDRLVAIWLFAIVACIIGFVALGNSKDNDEELDSATVQGKAPRSGYYDNEEGNHHYYKDKGGNGYRSNGQTTDYSPRRGGRGGAREDLHPFDLNIISPDEMQELGFTETQIRSVLKYRSMGGIYRYKEQLSKIAGMTKGDYDRLVPYFYVSDDFRPASDFVHVPQNKHRSNYHRNGSYHYNGSGGGNGSYRYNGGGNGNGSYRYNGGGNGGSYHYNGGGDSVSVGGGVGLGNSPTPPRYVSNKLRAGETIPLNASDTTALKRVPGIGSTFAKMIVKHREKLGGFYAIEQLDDLQAIPAEVQEYFSLDRVPLRKLKINSLPINRLVSHPYITFYQAQAIKEYIRKNGPLKSLSQLQLNKNFSQEDINRLEPYLDYE